MQNFFMVSLFSIFLATVATAESIDGTSVGFVLKGGHRDFSTGVSVTSPWLLDASLAIQGAVMQSWFMHGVEDNSGDEKWLPFMTYRLGLMGGRVSLGGFMRLYGSGGIQHVVTNGKLSDKNSVTGGYGAFGFEFISGRSLNYYLELGADGVGARADKLVGKPIYSTGFTSSVGFRYYL